MFFVGSIMLRFWICDVPEYIFQSITKNCIRNPGRLRSRHDIKVHLIRKEATLTAVEMLCKRLCERHIQTTCVEKLATAITPKPILSIVVFTNLTDCGVSPVIEQKDTVS